MAHQSTISASPCGVPVDPPFPVIDNWRACPSPEGELLIAPIISCNNWFGVILYLDRRFPRPSSMSIGFSGVPRMGIGGGGGEGDWNGGRMGKGSGEACCARLLWFFLKCIWSLCDFFMVKTSSNNIVAFAFCFCISCSICHIVEWRWSIVSIFWKAIRPSNNLMSSLKFSQESKITSKDSRFWVCRGCSSYEWSVKEEEIWEEEESVLKL